MILKMKVSSKKAGIVSAVFTLVSPELKQSQAVGDTCQMNTK